MLFVGRPVLGLIPELIIGVGVSAAALIVLSGTWWVLSKPPLLLVNGAPVAAFDVAPLTIDDEYLRRFSTAFFNQYASWNYYNIEARRTGAMGMCDPAIAGSVAEETGLTMRMARIMRMAQTIVSYDLRHEPVGVGAWRTTIDYVARIHNGGVAIEDQKRTMILDTIRRDPDKTYPYCVTVALVSDTISETTPTATDTIEPTRTP